MILQNILLPTTDICTEEQMFFRRCAGKIKYSFAVDYIDLEEDAFVSFDTYFNGFSAEKWFKYTEIKNVNLSVLISGKVRLSILRKEKIGGNIVHEIVGEYICDSGSEEKQKWYMFPINAAYTTGMYTFEILALSEEARFYKGYYSTEIDFEKIRDVKIALDICTYKRERFLKSNIECLTEAFLGNMDSELYDKLEIFISDNAHTLKDYHLETEKVHIFENKNVGGAGGFTRGMIEIKKVQEEKGITHILVMDDDVRIAPESIFRTYTLLSCLKDAYKDAFIGGAMLRLDRQWFQTESGAFWNAGNLVSCKHGLDTRTLDGCLYNEFEERPDFNAWWYCVIPANCVTDDNLPLPIFIRGDDVEFGLRNIKHLILMNGICVWHEPFENKYTSFLYYYLLRNRLIDNSLHNCIVPKKQFINTLYQYVMDEVRIYRYKNANLLMQGVEDFLKGVEWLSAQDGEELHKSVMNAGYKMQYVDDLEGGVFFSWALYEKSLQTPPQTGLKNRIINHVTYNGQTLSPKAEYAIVPVNGVVQAAVNRTRRLLNYDYTSRKGFVTEMNVNELKKCVRRLKQLEKKLNANYEKCCKQYHDDIYKLTNLDFWKQYLQLG